MLFGILQNKKLNQQVSSAIGQWNSFDDKSLKEGRVTQIFTAMGWTKHPNWDILGLDTAVKTKKTTRAIKTHLGQNKMTALKTSNTTSPIFKTNEKALLTQNGQIDQNLTWEQNKLALRQKIFGLASPLLDLSKKDLAKIQQYFQTGKNAPKKSILNAILLSALAIRSKPALAQILPRRLQAFFQAVDAHLDKPIQTLIQASFQSLSKKELSQLGKTLTTTAPTKEIFPLLKQDAPRSKGKTVRFPNCDEKPLTNSWAIKQATDEFSKEKPNPHELSFRLQQLLTQDAFGLPIAFLKLVFFSSGFSLGNTDLIDMVIHPLNNGAEVQYTYRAPITYDSESQHAGEMRYTFQLQLIFDPKKNCYNITMPPSVPTFSRTADAHGMIDVEI